MNGIQYLADGLFQGFPCILGRDPDRLGKAGHQISAVDIHCRLFGAFKSTADVDLDLLSRLFSDHQPEMVLDIPDNGFVEIISAHLDAAADDNAVDGKNRDRTGAAADVDEHVSVWL